MELLSFVTKLIGFSAILMFFFNWILTGGYYNLRIHKYDRKINIATKLLASGVNFGNASIGEYAESIIDSALFGIEYNLDCSAGQLNILRNMVKNGLSKRSVKVAARLIGPTGKLENYNFLQYLMYILYAIGSVLYAYIDLLMLVKVLNGFTVSNYKIEFKNISAQQHISSIIIYFIVYLAAFTFFVFQVGQITRGQKIVTTYDEKGCLNKKPTSFCRTYIWWWKN